MAGAEKNPLRLFGTSGIRGVPERFTKEFTEKLGLSLATFLGNKGEVLVGRDVRPTSPAISSLIISGLRAGGVTVKDCGVVPTPTLLFAVKRRGSAAAVVVTGSHAPPPINGILFFLSDTGEMDSGHEKKLTAIFESDPVPKEMTEWGTVEKIDVLNGYLQDLCQSLPDGHGFRVVVDPGNGAACETIGPVLDRLGCEVVAINDRPDGSFPERPPEPAPETLSNLSRVVVEEKADFGVGVDGDGDRAIFVAPSGRVLYGDQTGAIFAEWELKKCGGGRVIVPVNTTSMVAILCERYGGQVTATRIGPPAMAEAIRANADTIFATEESGKNIWPNTIKYSDATLSAGKMLEILRKEGKNLDELADGLPKLHQSKIDIGCKDELKVQAMNYILSDLEATSFGKLSNLDGIRVDCADKSWVLARASGTEPMLRCYAESPDPAEATKLASDMAQRIRNAIAKAQAD